MTQPDFMGVGARSLIIKSYPTHVFIFRERRPSRDAMGWAV
ncbi:hypothetical protein H1P_3450001 [Hyella patelloides LEGE 07179]|uniref:Uncharacterized protein n=1 Tax=Hyella patelloides LEGE 07179 TaxID=945734 RepID=A0A563VVS8_9CYAN|nr:hypothetical protein H1P_3450001 [Hyella patelloides LEGE 07179]